MQGHQARLAAYGSLNAQVVGVSRDDIKTLQYWQKHLRLSFPLLSTEEKYHRDSVFSDPWVQCDSCNKLIPTSQLHTLGMCECGNRRVRNVLSMTESERDICVNMGTDPAWLKLFEGVEVPAPQVGANG